MRARKFALVIMVSSLGLIASTAGAVSVAETAASNTAGSVVAAGMTRAASPDIRLDVAERVTVPYRISAQRADLRLASLSPGPAVLAATAQPQPAPVNSTKDFLLLTLVGGMLVAYQLLRKHRLLRQQPFSL